MPRIATQSIIAYMNQRLFLFQLQNVDSKIDAAQKRVLELELIISSDVEIATSQNQINIIKNQAYQKNQEIKSIEIDASILQKKIKASEESLYNGTIKNPKELQTVQVEIASLRNRLASLEENQLTILIEVEDLENSLVEKNLVHTQLVAQKNNSNSILISEISDLNRQLNNFFTEKNSILPQIDPAHLKKYEELRTTRNKIAVATVIDAACSACGNTFSPADIQKIRSPIDEFNCQICRRIMYNG